MKFVLLLSVLFSLSAAAWEGREDWNLELDQEMLLNCDSGEGLCLETCGDEYQCRMPAGFCKNCVGTGVLLSFFYQEVGRWFVNSGERISEEELADFLKQRRFMLLTFDSPYNIFTSVRDRVTERAFNSLCPGVFDSFPVVLGALNERGELGKISGVICHGENGAEIYQIKSMPNAEINLQRLLKGLLH